jgi:hypothetical protein
MSCPRSAKRLPGTITARNVRLLTLIAGKGKQERGSEQHRNEQYHLEELNGHSWHPAHQE